MNLEDRVKQQLLSRGFSKEQLLNNRGLIGAAIDEAVLSVVKNLAIHDVSVSLPTKDEVCAEGYRIANDAGYNYRRVLRDQDHDIYYSGWMDCFDWILKGNER